MPGANLFPAVLTRWEGEEPVVLCRVVRAESFGHRGDNATRAQASGGRRRNFPLSGSAFRCSLGADETGKLLLRR